MLLPKPLPDEVVGSLLIRACLRTGLNRNALLHAIYETRRSSASFLLGSTVAELAPLAGMEPEDFLRAHTIFPYATAFMSERLRALLLLKAVMRGMDDTHLGTLTHSVTRNVATWRFCNLCVEEDVARWGESYWHRIHQLPAAWLCLIHRAPLSTSDIALRGTAVTWKRLLLPHHVLGVPLQLTRSHELHERLTLNSTAYLSEPAVDVESLLLRYRGRALELGWLVNGNVAGGAMSRALRQHYGRELLLESGSRAGGRRDWPALMVRLNTQVSFTPVKHILLNTFFQTSQDALPQLARAEDEKPGPKVADGQRRDHATARKVQVLLNRLAKCGERVTVTSLLMRAGAWETFRHDRSRFPMTNALVQEFRRSDLAERQVGRRPAWRRGSGE